MKQIVLLVFSLLISLYADDTFYALKGGVLSHSTGSISSGLEDGIDLHTELLFQPQVLKAYPAIGVDINLNSDTSFLYGGLAWEGRFFKHMLLGTFFGLSVHNGELDNGNDDKRKLGTRTLFRGAIDIGFYLNQDLAISFIYDHYSNLGVTGKRNQGNDNMGIQLSYYF